MVHSYASPFQAYCTASIHSLGHDTREKREQLPRGLADIRQPNLAFMLASEHLSAASSQKGNQVSLKLAYSSAQTHTQIL